MERSEFNGHSMRASIDLQSINKEERSFDVVMFTDAPVRYRDYKYKERMEGEPETYDEVFSMDATAIETERLDSGIPLFPSHWERASLSQLGISTTYQLGERGCTGKIKLGARADEALWQDIQNEVVKSFSIGVKIFEVERSVVNGVLQYKATKWSPMHLAIAPEPADVNCTTLRSSDTVVKDLEIKQENEPENFLNSIINKF